MIRKLELDSKLFGQPVYRWEPDWIDTKGASEVAALRHRVGLPVVYLRLRPDASDDCRECLARADYVGTRVELEVGPEWRRTYERLRSFRVAENPRGPVVALENMLSKASWGFPHSRFRRDSRLPTTSVTVMFRGWLREQLFRAPHTRWVAFAGGTAVGFVTSLLKEEGHVEIGFVWTDEEVSGEGVGTALLSDCLEYWFSNGAKFVGVATQASNVPALRLYQKLGFKVARVAEEWHVR